MNKVFVIIIGFIVVGVVGWLAVSGNNAPKETARRAQSARAPDFRLQDFTGKAVSLADFAGKPIVINSWAAWCPFCRKELVDFAAAQREFGEGIVIVAVDRAESREVAKKYSDELGATDDLIFLLDPSDSFYQSIGGFSMPETIFVDKDGFIREHKRGPMDIKEIKQKIQKLISQ